MTAATQERTTCLDCHKPVKHEGRCGWHDRAAIRREEIEWLRSFGWHDERIAERFGIRPVSLERYAYARGAHR